MSSMKTGNQRKDDLYGRVLAGRAGYQEPLDVDCFVAIAVLIALIVATITVVLCVV